MKILGLESSALVAGVAIWQDDEIIAEYIVNYKKTHSQTLLPMLEEVVAMTETDLSQVDAIAISAGPGSFTGLRIGSATAKGLGLALNKPLIEVPTLKAMAYQCYGYEGYICPIMDARRNQVYTGVYTYEDWSLTEKMAPCAEDIDELVRWLNRQGRPVVFIGDGIKVQSVRLKETLCVPYQFAPAILNRQRAAAVAALGAIQYEAGDIVPAADHHPEYLRKSQAEREREEKALHHGGENGSD